MFHPIPIYKYLEKKFNIYIFNIESVQFKTLNISIDNLNDDELLIYRSINNKLKQRSYIIEKYIRNYILLNTFQLQSIQILKTDSGKPYLLNNNCYYNTSNSKNYFAIITSNSHEVGIDIETNYKPDKIDSYSRVLFNEIYAKEFNSLKNDQKVLTFYKIWTLLEAYCKCNNISLLSQFKSNLINTLWKKKSSKSRIVYKDSHTQSLINNLSFSLSFSIKNSNLLL